MSQLFMTGEWTKSAIFINHTKSLSDNQNNWFPNTNVISCTENNQPDKILHTQDDKQFIKWVNTVKNVFDIKPALLNHDL